MQRRNIIAILLIAFGIDIYAADKFDIQVCEAQPTDASKIECYNSLRLNTSCNNMEISKQLSCYRKSTEALLNKEGGYSSQQNMGQNHINDFFLQAQRLCSVLSSDGLATNGWKASKSIPGEWLCMSSLIPFGSIGADGMENNIALYVNGTSVTRANDIRIKININNPSERKQAFDRLESATKSLFKAISTDIPSEILNGLAKQKPASASVAFGKVELIFEPGRIESFKIVLTDGQFLAAKEKTRISSASEFDSCKEVTAKAAGYSASLVSGDGNPIQEATYKSFMLKGQGKDLFFCEVHSGNRYKVSAALNGNFPFKYIAEGSLQEYYQESPSPHKSIPQSMMSEFRFIAQGGQSIVATTNTSVSANNKHSVVFTPNLEKTDGNLYQAALESMIYLYGKERGIFQLKDAKMLPEPSIGGNAICWKVQNPESDYCVFPTKDDVTGRIVGLQVWMK